MNNKKSYYKFAFRVMVVTITLVTITFMLNTFVCAISANEIDFSSQPFNNSDTHYVWFSSDTNYLTYQNALSGNSYIGASNGQFFIISKEHNLNELKSQYILYYNDSTHYYFNQDSGSVQVDNDTWYYSWTTTLYGSNQYNYIVNIPYYAWPVNYISIINDINDTSNNGGNSGNESYNLNYSLPAGNVAYIEIGNGELNFAELETIMPVKSVAFSSDTGWNGTQRFGFAETLPSNGNNLANFGSQIQWAKTGSTNIFGQTQNANYLISNITGHKYLVIVNPLYYAIQYTNGEGIVSAEAGVNSTVNNNSIDITIQSAKGISVYQLTQSVTINNNIPSYDNDITSGAYEGDIDPNTGDVTWTDPDGGNNQPTTGGGNVPGTGENNFSSFLSGIANRIVNVFQPAHDAILTLSNAVQNISSWMYALYVWLPAPVLSLLTSAISLAIIIGLIKVFI